MPKRSRSLLLIAACAVTGCTAGLPSPVGNPAAPRVDSHGIPPLETVAFDDDNSGDYEVYTAKLRWPHHVYGAQPNYAIESPHGMCSDFSNYWVTSFTGSSVTEISFSGQLIRTLSDSGEDPESCAIDYTSGNVAVTNYSTASGGHGSVYIYPGGSGKPIKYTNVGSPAMQHLLFAVYDRKGDLFVDGTAPGGAPQVDELTNGSTAFHALNISAIPLLHPGALVWGGKRLSIADQQTSAANSPKTCVAEPKSGCAALYLTNTNLKGDKIILDGTTNFTQTAFAYSLDLGDCGGSGCSSVGVPNATGDGCASGKPCIQFYEHTSGAISPRLELDLTALRSPYSIVSAR